MSADTGKVEPAQAAADILAGMATTNATVSNTGIVTVPAGKTWVGTITLQCACTVAAASTVAGQATGVILIAGAGASPAAGNYLRCDALAGANAAGGTTGADAEAFASTPLTVVAPIGNSVNISYNATIAGTAGQVSATASGVLQ